MVSVTSDVIASANFQNAPPKLALPDPSQLTGGFASLVDSNLATNPSNTLPPAPEPPASPHAMRNQNTSAAPRNNSEAPGNNTQGANQNPPPGGGPSDNSTGTDQTQPTATGADQNNSNAQQSTTTAKDGTSKAGGDKSADKTSDDSGKTTDSAGSDATAQPVGQLLAAANPIAALLPVAGTITGTPTPPGNANAPLAIAAAAIAATSSTAASLTAMSAQTKTGGAANGTTTTDATTADATRTDAGKAPAQGVAIDPKVATQLIPTTDASASPDGSLLTAAGSTGATKADTTGSSPTAASPTKVATNAATGAQATTDPSATAATTNALQNGPAPPLAADARPGTHVTPVDAVKADGNGTSAPSTTDHSQAAPNVQASANPADAGAQLTAVPQQLSATTPPAATGNFSVTQATGAAVPISGLAVTIAATAQSGKTSFELRLDPADLGRIDVRINVDNNGQVTSHLTVEKPETLSMLRQDAPQLQQALNDAGLKTGSGGLQFSLRDQSSSFGQNNPGNQNGGQPQRLLVTQEDTAPPAIAGRSYGRMPGSSSGVDIRV